jgi:hypothetical protein
MGSEDGYEQGSRDERTTHQKRDSQAFGRRPGVHTIEENSTPAASVRAVLDTRNVQPNARVGFIAADREDAGRLDAVAGCEFVDDRIRLRE